MSSVDGTLLPTPGLPPQGPEPALPGGGERTGHLPFVRRLLARSGRARQLRPGASGGAPARLGASTRVALALTAAGTLGVLLILMVSYTLFSQQAQDDLDTTLVAEADAFGAALASVSVEGPEDIVAVSNRYFHGRTTSNRALLALRLPDGTVAQSAPSPLTGPSGVFAGSASGGTTSEGAAGSEDFRTVNVGGEEFRVAVFPVVDEAGAVLAYAQAALPTRSLHEASDRMARSLLLAGLIVVIGGAVFSRRLARQALRPLHDAALTAERVTHSSLSARVPYHGPRDDVALLVESLNSMLERLETAFAEQRRFVADASHEMRTPLTVMQGHLDVMRAEGGLTPDQEGTLDLVMDELGRTSRLVSDLLSLARLERGLRPLFRPLDVSEVAEEAIVRAQGLGNRRFVLSHGGHLPVEGNRDLLLEALLNLLSNAVAHTEDEGRIAVTCRDEGGRAIIDVADDGPGIPPEELERIFDRFYRGPGRPRRGGGGGSGLGLPIARRLIELHGGTLTARNTPEGGAVFSLQIPLQKGD